MIDPYPSNLAVLDEVETRPADPLVAAINRLAQAVEQNTLALLDRPQNTPGAALTALPPIRTAPAASADLCPIHGTPWKIVPAGVSAKTGKAYDAFRACSTRGCDQRPR